MNLQNANCIVTGVSKGIGLATIKALIDRGANVIGWGRTEPQFNHQRFTFIECQVSDEDSVEKAFQKSISLLGNEVQVLVNNAGFGAFSPIEKMESSVWKEMFDVNVHGVYFAIKRVLPIMKKAQYGTIINISSIGGLGGINEAAAYCGTKFAVRGISQAVYQEVKKENIRVSCIFPGSVNTHFFDGTGVNANESMIGSADIAKTLIGVLEMPDHVCQSEIEIRPLNPLYS